MLNLKMKCLLYVFFFFQAEDGIRDRNVTGVQTCALPILVSTGPRLLIADEPTSALDVAVSMQVLAVLDAMIARHGTGLMFISHDLPLVMSFCDRVAVMYAGQIGRASCRERGEGSGADGAV